MDSNNLNKQPQQEVEAVLLEKAIKNRKTITWSIVGLLAVVAIGFVIWLVMSNNSRKADEAIAKADIELNDSTALALYKEAAEMGSKSGARAALNVAIALYQKGEYQEAINYLKKASVSSSIIEAGRYSLMGDCYVNLGDNSQALDCFKKAVNAADNNPQVAPFVLVKEANIYRAEGKYKEEYDCYSTILNKYPAYTNSLRVDIRKYAERAKAQAGL